jgi:hypothetical protein
LLQQRTAAAAAAAAAAIEIEAPINHLQLPPQQQQQQQQKHHAAPFNAGTWQVRLLWLQFQKVCARMRFGGGLMNGELLGRAG